MKKDFFNCELCEQLARELVTEQAELLKHEVLVKEIKAKLVEGKQQLIRKLISCREFFLDGKNQLALYVSFDERWDDLRVSVTLGLDPDAPTLTAPLTKKERELFQEYRNMYLYCKESHDDSAGYYAIELAKDLEKLKSGIKLTYVTCWDIDFGKATTPGFFEQSGLVVHRKTGYYMLEDLER